MSRRGDGAAMWEFLEVHMSTASNAGRSKQLKSQGPSRSAVIPAHVLGPLVKAEEGAKAEEGGRHLIHQPAVVKTGKEPVHRSNQQLHGCHVSVTCVPQTRVLYLHGEVPPIMRLRSVHLPPLKSASFQTPFVLPCSSNVVEPAARRFNGLCLPVQGWNVGVQVRLGRCRPTERGWCICQCGPQKSTET